MPRPGPRPYECVRRAWHSDRHHPMRGSIIQQIFRVVHESHTAGTKKNREWQEKLPLVVLKSEEIMYSKANSEAEYMDPETIWDRVNDAINTIIRKDESLETGDLLPPCVEAALNLGCVPVRASRSQRNSNPRSYLSPRAQDSVSIPPTILDNATNARNPNLQNVERPMPVAQTQANRNEMQNYKNSPSASGNYASSCEKFPLPGNNRFLSGESKTSLDVGSVYPLYYGAHSQPEVSQTSYNPKRSNTIIVGTPIFQAVSEPPENVCLQNLFRGHGDEIASNRIFQSDFTVNHEKEPKSMECDLSLRLGLLSDPCLSRGKSSTCNNNEAGPSLSQESGSQSKEFSFFPVASANEPLDPRGWNFEGEGQNVETAVRKRKVAVDNNLEGGQFFWQLESTSNQMKRRGL